MTDPRFPIGPFQTPGQITEALRNEFIEHLALAPGLLAQAVRGLSGDQLDTPYRDGGWTVRQVVHHLADSHINGYARLRHALTEDAPTVKVYDEKLWAELPDAKVGNIDMSLNLFAGLHERLVCLLRSLKPEQFARKLLHPQRGELSIDSFVALYAWHSRHHVGHITMLRAAKGW
jgi:hypothetical protein